MHGFRRAAVAVALLLGSGLPLAAQPARLLPVDQAARDPSFVRFRTRLVEAVRRRDAAYVQSILAADITNSFGGNGGRAEFREMWDPEHPASQLWSALEEVLRLGGAFRGDSIFQAPYVYSSWPERFDNFEYGAIVGSNVRVRGRPFLGAPIIGALSYDIVRMAHERGSNGFEAIHLPDGRVGYIATRFLRRSTDYRAIFVKRNGRWLLKALVAGD